MTVTRSRERVQSQMPGPDIYWQMTPPIEILKVEAGPLAFSVTSLLHAGTHFQAIFSELHRCYELSCRSTWPSKADGHGCV